LVPGSLADAGVTDPDGVQFREEDSRSCSKLDTVPAVRFTERIPTSLLIGVVVIGLGAGSAFADVTPNSHQTVRNTPERGGEAFPWQACKADHGYKLFSGECWWRVKDEPGSFYGNCVNWAITNWPGFGTMISGDPTTWPRTMPRQGFKMLSPQPHGTVTKAKPGDLVIWKSGVDGAGQGTGHVAYVVATGVSDPGLTQLDQLGGDGPARGAMIVSEVNDGSDAQNRVGDYRYIYANTADDAYFFEPSAASFKRHR
jgi:CHAP domain